MAATVVKTCQLVKCRKVGTKTKYVQEENNLDVHKNYVHSKRRFDEQNIKIVHFPYVVIIYGRKLKTA
jgi:hypothetical protein